MRLLTGGPRPRMRKWLMGSILAIATMRLAGATDLLEVYHLAQAGDPTFEAARYTLKTLQEKLPQARAGLLPVIAASCNTNRTHADTTFSETPTITRGVHAWNWAVQLTQPLIRLQNLYAYSESESLVEQATAQFAQAEPQLV